MHKTNEKFVKLFESYNCTISEFANELGIPFMTVSSWLKDRKEMKEYVYKLIVNKLESEKNNKKIRE